MVLTPSDLLVLVALILYNKGFYFLPFFFSLSGP